MFLLFLSGSYGMAGNMFFSYGVYAVLIGMIIMTFFMKEVKLEYNKSLIVLVILYALIAILSALFNSQIILLLNGLVFLVMFVSTSVVSYSYFNNSIGKIVIYTFLLSQIPVILIPLLSGVETFPYSGIFENPNAFGIAAATLFAVILSILFSNIEETVFFKKKPSKIKMIAFIFITTLSFLLVIISSSRTSFLAGVVSIMVGLFCVFLLSIKYKRTINLIIKTVVSLPILYFLYLIINKFIPIQMYLQENTLSKFAKKSSNSLDGRGYVWEKTISEASIFGHGEGYFDGSIDLGAHNTFIYILGVYGWLATIVFTLFIFISMYYCIKFIFSNNNYKYLPILMMTTFLVLSIGENMFNRITMMMVFILIGLVANNSKVVVTS